MSNIKKEEKDGSHKLNIAKCKMQNEQLALIILHWSFCNEN